MRALATAAVALMLLAGCVSPPAETPADVDAASVLTAAGSTFRATTGHGAIATLALESGPDAQVEFPEGTLVMTEEGRLLPAGDAVHLVAGGSVRFLAPYGLDALEVQVGGETLSIPTGDAEPLVSGDVVVSELKYQEANFPHRTPGMPNYAASQAYFASYFEALGYEVEVDPYGLMAGDGVRTPFLGARPSSMANVVGIKRGTLSPERYLVFGGHYDMVEQTVHAAFDDSGGSMATLATAKAFANVTTEHTLVFGLWGGEEDGILGSRFWVETNKEKIPFIDGYYNFDVTGIAWPAPANDPAPIVVAAGPDGPMADALHAISTEIETTWLALPAVEWIHQPIAVGGQVGGAGVNAQSDHTSFATNGIPAWMPFTSRVDDVFAIIHKESDTLENMTKYAMAGNEGIDQTFTPEEMATGEDLVARSFETQMYHAFYWAVLTDAGHFEVPRPSPGVAGLL